MEPIINLLTTYLPPVMILLGIEQVMTIYWVGIEQVNIQNPQALALSQTINSFLNSENKLNALMDKLDKMRSEELLSGLGLICRKIRLYSTGSSKDYLYFLYIINECATLPDP